MRKFINQITHGDCLEYLQYIPDNSIDLTFADPPFNLKKEYSNYKDQKELNDYLEWCEKWLNEMVRITKPTGSICVHNIPMWLTYFSGILNKKAYFKHWISWDALSKPRGKSLQPAHYGILFYAKDKKKQKIFELRAPHKRDRRTGFLQKDYGGKKDTMHPFGPILTDVWSDIHRIKHNGHREKHPCQLPCALLERLILLTTNKGNIVLDLFAGTGVTSVAAKKLGRKFIAFEIDKNYVEIAQRKLSTTNHLSKIKSCFISIYRNNLITIREQDWQTLKNFFVIPRPRRLIDQSEIRLKDKIRIINDIVEMKSESKVIPISKRTRRQKKQENKLYPLSIEAS